jgi:hypothetical protein
MQHCLGNIQFCVADCSTENCQQRFITNIDKYSHLKHSNVQGLPICIADFSSICKDYHEPLDTKGVQNNSN